jgi:hypothetical protein
MDPTYLIAQEIDDHRALAPERQFCTGSPREHIW